MQYSYSRVDCYDSCPYKFKLRYLDRLDTLPSDDPANALILGKALHTGLEKGVDAAVAEYLMSYPIVTDEHFDEVMKLEHLIPIARQMLPDDGKFEAPISNDDFIGYLDYLVTVGDGYELYDFKYSNNSARYHRSRQLHIYKYFFEMCNPDKRIDNMYFLMIPKVGIKRGKKEELQEFRKRIQAALKKVEPFLIPIEYDFRKVGDFLLGVKHSMEDSSYAKNPTYLCNWCEYQTACESNGGIDYMLIYPWEK